GGRFVESVAVLTPINHPLTGLAAGRGCSGLQIGGVACEKRFDFGTGHIDGESRSDKADNASAHHNSTCNKTHDLVLLENEDAADRAIVSASIPPRHVPEDFLPQNCCLGLWDAALRRRTGRAGVRPGAHDLAKARLRAWCRRAPEPGPP